VRGLKQPPRSIDSQLVKRPCTGRDLLARFDGAGPRSPKRRITADAQGRSSRSRCPLRVARATQDGRTGFLLRRARASALSTGKARQSRSERDLLFLWPTDVAHFGDMCRELHSFRVVSQFAQRKIGHVVRATRLRDQVKKILPRSLGTRPRFQLREISRRVVLAIETTCKRALFMRGRQQEGILCGRRVSACIGSRA